MARAGLYKSDVKKARDALLAKGHKPSIDAVRIELGNTGSKTTIHKYLRELDEEYGAVDAMRATLSDALADLVERLAARLQEEADERYAVRCQAFETETREHQIALHSAQAESARLAAHAHMLEQVNQEVTVALASAQEASTHESTARQLAELRAADLSERLEENEAHRRSLEEKHQHARDALEHFRQAAKEQRDGDLRRHEQQVQQLQAELRQANLHLALKHDETTRLNREGAQLITELTHARQACAAAEDAGKRQAQEIKDLRTRVVDCEILSAQIAERNVAVTTLQDQVTASVKQRDALATQLHNLELTLTQAQAQAQTLEKMNLQLQALIASGQRTPDPAQST